MRQGIAEQFYEHLLSFKYEKELNDYFKETIVYEFDKSKIKEWRELDMWSFNGHKGEFNFVGFFEGIRYDVDAYSIYVDKEGTNPNIYVYDCSHGYVLKYDKSLEYYMDTINILKYDNFLLHTNFIYNALEEK